MRAMILLLALVLAGCNTTRSPSVDLQPAAAPPPPAAPPPAAPAPSSADGPRGARDVTEAKVICWGKVERDKRVRSIDQRIAYVEKCVAEQMKAN
jgi:hypothetical protein